MNTTNQLLLFFFKLCNVVFAAIIAPYDFTVGLDHPVCVCVCVNVYTATCSWLAILSILHVH